MPPIESGMAEKLQTFLHYLEIFVAESTLHWANWDDFTNRKSFAALNFSEKSTNANNESRLSMYLLQFVHNQYLIIQSEEIVQFVSTKLKPSERFYHLNSLTTHRTDRLWRRWKNHFELFFGLVFVHSLFSTEIISHLFKLSNFTALVR